MEHLVANTSRGPRVVTAENVRLLRQETIGEYVYTYLLLEGKAPSVCVWIFNANTKTVALQFNQVSEIYERLLELTADPYLLCAL